MAQRPILPIIRAATRDVDSGTNSIDVSQQMFDGIASKLTSSQRQLLSSSVIDGRDVSVSDLKLAGVADADLCTGRRRRKRRKAEGRTR
jgi:hypothetical protein